MRQPYIGVTGFMTKEEVSAALKALDDLPNWSTRTLMVGVLASSKTLRGEANEWPKRYPQKSDIAGLFPNHPRAVNLIHFATDDQHTLPEQLQMLELLGGRNLDGFQLNMVWPDPSRIVLQRSKRVVLQIGRRAMELFNHDPTRVAEELDHYTEVITDVLVDTSSGRGIAMDVEVTKRYVRAISDRHRNLRIGVAGGLCHDQMGRLQLLADRFPNLSVNAEGRLRDHDDHLNIPTMHRYIQVADGLFSP